MTSPGKPSTSEALPGGGIILRTEEAESTAGRLTKSLHGDQKYSQASTGALRLPGQWCLEPVCVSLPCTMSHSSVGPPEPS